MPPVVPPSDASCETTPDGAGCEGTQTPANDAAAAETTASDVPFERPPEVERFTGCTISNAGVPGISTCNEWRYLHDTEIVVRRNECMRLQVGGNTTQFFETGGCPRDGNVGCCRNRDGSLTQCYYPPIYSTSLVEMVCTVPSVFVPP